MDVFLGLAGKTRGLPGACRGLAGGLPGNFCTVCRRINAKIVIHESFLTISNVKTNFDPVCSGLIIVAGDVVFAKFD